MTESSPILVFFVHLQETNLSRGTSHRHPSTTAQVALASIFISVGVGRKITLCWNMAVHFLNCRARSPQVQT